MCDSCDVVNNLVVSDEEIEAAVEKGAARLDNREGNWFNDPNLWVDDLDMKSYRQCLLGQLYGDYCDGCNVMDLVDNDEARVHGFLLVPTASNESYERLGGAWKAQIAKRREAVAA
jgi:hypothetical protein